MMKALLLNAETKTAVVQTIPIPKLNTTGTRRQLLIRIEAIALNPVDSLYVANPIGETGRTVGSDFAGVVVDIFPTSTSTSTSNDKTKGEIAVEIGDRVAGLVQGSNSANPRPGAFAEYLLLEDDDVDLIWKIPSRMTLEQAAGVSLCGLTAAQGVYFRLGIPAPFTWGGQTTGTTTTPTITAGEREDETTTVLIYGASTSLGLYAAQLVNLGFQTTSSRTKLRLIGLARRSKFDMLRAKPYKYTHLLDYHDPTWPDQVRALTGQTGTGNGGVDYALDCISEGDTVRHILGTLAKSSHSRLAIFRSKQSNAWNHDTTSTVDTKRAIYGAVWEGLGHDIRYGNGMLIPATEESRNFTLGFYNWLSSGQKGEFEDGDGKAEQRLEPNPIRLMPGGLERIVPDGFALLGGGRMEDRNGERRTEEWMRPVSAEKLVYRIRD